jgi:hypothetical protein
MLTGPSEASLQVEVVQIFNIYDHNLHDRVVMTRIDNVLNGTGKRATNTAYIGASILKNE